MTARWSQALGEDGSASLEFVGISVLLLVPLVYLVIALAQVQAASYAVSAAARDAGRLYVSAPTVASAPVRARAAADLVFQDFGLRGRGHLALTCSGTCLAPDSSVRTTASTQVDLPMIPEFVRSVVPLRIPVSATAVTTVDRYRDPAS